MIDRNSDTDERDHLTPADLLSDDPDESVDPTAIRARSQNRLGPGACAELRDALRGSPKTAEIITSELGIEMDGQNVRRHYRGRCAHDHDTAPVKWDYGTSRWTTDD